MSTNKTAGKTLRRRSVLAVAAVFVAAGCASAGVSANPAQAQSLGGAKATVIGMKSLKFSPSKVTVKVNQQVDFSWNESVAHNVVFDKTRKSKTLAKKGAIWSTKFDKAGKFKFKCTLHPGMQGEVTVSNSAAPAKK
jgi:plastocyanin